jgi:hypothetical protein
VSSVYGYYYDSLYNVFKNTRKADSAIILFDIQKTKLQARQARILTYNILIDNHFLEPGDYKFQTRLRTRTNYSTKSGKRALDKIEYINSDWYYFKVKDSMMSSLIKPL